jgi:cell division septation protein DedD
MRFEVKGGGIAAILFALTLLSGAVFALGLLAGYDVGRQAQIDTSQLATSYPLQSPPTSAAPSQIPVDEANRAMPSAASSPSPAAGTAPMAEASAASASLAGESPSTRRRPFPPHTTQERQRLVAASSSASAPPTAAADSALGEETDAPDSENSEALTQPLEGSTNQPTRRSATVRHKAYNIQIEAAMDISGADRMIARLQKLGYTSHLVPTEIAGQRWYKVEVGPYATAEEASSAEAEMRQKYNQTYGKVARGNSAEASASDDSDE